jgi:6-phosphofructokinase 1
MSATRIPSGFDDPIISEKLLIDEMLAHSQMFPEVKRIGDPLIDNLCIESRVGKYIPFDARKCVTTDWEIINKCNVENKPAPTFFAAGPRKFLYHNPRKVKAAIVTTGGIAPGLNNVIHSIVKRHHDIYELSRQGKVFGIQDSFQGICELCNYMEELEPSKTEWWLEKGGSMLGMRRYHQKSKEELAQTISEQLSFNNINANQE